MRTSHYLAGALFILGCATGAAVRDFVVPARAQGQAPVTYQYTTFNLQELGLAAGKSEEKDAVLNRYGQQGWRVAGVVGATVIFERSFPFQPATAPPAHTPNTF